MYVTWDAPADNTDKLKTWEDGSLCENKSWATSIGLRAINNGRLLPNLEEPASQETSAAVCCSVDGGRGKWSVREDSGDPVVSLAISPCVAASFSRRRCSRHSTPRCSHWGQFKVSSIHLLLFQMWTWPHSLCGLRWRMPRKNTKEHRHGGPSHSLAKGKAFDYCSKTSNTRNGNERKEERGMRESSESYRKMCVGPLKQLCSTSLMHHGDRCSVTWKYHSHAKRSPIARIAVRQGGGYSWFISFQCCLYGMTRLNWLQLVLT